MKKKHLSILLIAFISFAYSFDPIWMLGNHTPIYEFALLNESEAQLKIELYDYKKEIVCNYTTKIENGITFLYLDKSLLKEIPENSSLFGHQKDEGSEKLLLLMGSYYDDLYKKNDVICLVYANSEDKYPFAKRFKYFEGSTRIYKNLSSFLVEKDKTYDANGLCSVILETPWVENAPGYGIGESFVIENSWGKIYKTLLIMNGYISYEKPYLYEQNGRVKQIKVTGVKSGKSKLLNVLDTPHPQTVDISFITEAEDIKIEIADAYKGTKYEDTCIHYMITWDREVIPYENELSEKF